MLARHWTSRLVFAPDRAAEPNVLPMLYESDADRLSVALTDRLDAWWLPLKMSSTTGFAPQFKPNCINQSISMFIFRRHIVATVFGIRNRSSLGSVPGYAWRRQLAFEVSFIRHHHAAHGVALQMLPHEFIGNTIRRVRWKEEQFQPASQRFDKGSRLFRPVRRASIDDQKNHPRFTDRQSLEKLDKDVGIYPAFFLDHEPHVHTRRCNGSGDPRGKHFSP
jgi:hypothetical protein